MFSNRLVTSINVNLPDDSQIPANESTVLIGVFNFFGAVSSFFIVKRYSRRMVFLCGQFGIAICLASLTFCIRMNKGYAAVASILAFEVVLNATVGPVHWVYLPEVLNDTQFGFIATVHYLNAVEIALTTEWLIEVFSPAGVFLIYTIITSLGFVFMWVFLQETQGLADW